MKETLREKTAQLMMIPGISGHEGHVVKFLRDRLEGLADEVFVDSLGNLFALRRGARPGPRFMLAAHTDQLGAVIRYIDPNGFLRFEKVGGVLDSLLLGRKVSVGGVPGIIGVKPGHYQTEEEKRTVPKPEQMFIDVGAESDEGVRELGITIGTPVTYWDEMTVMEGGNRFAGAGLDDRAGCAVSWQTLEEVG
ncbi:MAG: M42 family peptidase, partial [Clostridia bacterium]